MRLNRFLARAGTASRRKSDDLIRRGLVRVNGIPVTEPGFRVGINDRVTFRNKVIKLPPQVTAVLNKPVGYETTFAVGGKIRTVAELMVGMPPGVVPVGRLDVNTGGLLLLSNDGELVNRLTHPSWGVERKYVIRLASPPTREELLRMRKGAEIAPGEFSKPISVRRTGDRTIAVVLSTGRHREVRRLCSACGIRVFSLERTRYGPITLSGVKRGAYRILDRLELAALRKSAGLDASKVP